MPLALDLRLPAVWDTDVALGIIDGGDRIPVVHCSRCLEPPGVASTVLPAAGMNPSRVFRVNPSSPATSEKVSSNTSDRAGLNRRWSALLNREGGWAVHDRVRCRRFKRR